MVAEVVFEIVIGSVFISFRDDYSQDRSFLYNITLLASRVS